MTDQMEAQPPPAVAMARLAATFWASRAVQVTAKLGLADLLAGGPRPPADLADATGTDPDALYRLLRALAGLGVFATDAEGRFRLTRMGECLRTDMPGSVHGFAVMLGEPESWRPWGELEHSIRTGRPAFDRVFGEPIFDYFSKHPEAARLFDEGMSSRSAQEAAAFVAAYDLSGVVTVVDVAGGRGGLLAAVLRVNAGARGVLFDLPHVTEGAREALAVAGLTDRCHVEAGNFFERVPEGGDVYLLHKVVHDWEDDRARAILANCRAAMRPGGRLLMLEAVVPPGDAPHLSKLLDMTMMVLPGGRERTTLEYEALLASAGLRLVRVVPTASEAVSVVEAVLA
jgi:SAM-dependent methyltransferase